jgi:hypothetical protein
MKISVLTPSVRRDGIDIVKKALEGQTFKDFEWIIGSPFTMPKHFIKNPFYWVEDDFEYGFWTLNRIYNKMFKKAKGELIVSLQDWIYVQPDALEKFWINYQEVGPKALISGVGDQYERLGKYNRPEVKIWSDPRKTMNNGSFYESYPQDCEWNFAAIPKKALFEVGGMDEELDFLGFGGDQFGVGQRLNDLGYKFFLDQTNESFTIRHSRSDFGGQQYWDENHVLLNGKYDKRKMQLLNEGKWPVLDYLKSDII